MNPFKVGDVVHHVRFGKGKIVDIIDSVVPYQVEVNACGGLSVTWSGAEYLSFKPWPAPCHERPIEDGWWIVSDKCTKIPLPLVRKKAGKDVMDIHGQVFSSKNYKFIRYLGEDWRK